MNTGVLESRSEPFSSLGGQAIEWLNQDGTIIVDDRLLQCDHTSRFEISERAPQRVKWICRIHEHETTNDSVYVWAKLDLPKIPHYKTHISQAVCSCPLLGERHLG